MFDQDEKEWNLLAKSILAQVRDNYIFIELSYWL